MNEKNSSSGTLWQNSNATSLEQR